MTILLTVLCVFVLVGLVLQTGRLRHRERTLDSAVKGLAKQEPMAHLGMLLAGVAHELSTPLGAIHCCLDTRRRGLEKLAVALDDLQEADPADPDPGQHLEKVLCLLGAVRGTDQVLDVALERAGVLVRHLRLTGRGQEDDLEAVDLNDVVDGAMLLLHNALKQGVTVHVDRADLPPVTGHAGTLGSIVINLLDNARQALDGSGQVFVRTFVRDGSVGLTVADDGPGLPDCGHARGRIFEAGFTTKGEDEGTGLGLYIARKVALVHGGSLEASNREGGGAEFTLLLPAASGDGAGG
ncbi:MAG: HAMP domain-containing histidine kinase [bacterium]|nr:HAMP domain-containing histidine kinase [bacterium]